MATVPVNPYSLKNATLAIAADDYTAAVTQVELTPNTSASSVRTIDGVVHRDQSSAEWAANIGFLQDLTANSLLRYLFDHEGEKKLATFTPVTAGPVITATLIISPAAVGGATSANGNMTATVALAVDGKPVLTDASSAPVVSAASPSGAAAGALVVITGIKLDGVSAVKFGATNATAFTVVSSSTIVATVPAGTAGAANITVTTPNGTSSALTYTRGA